MRSKIKLLFSLILILVVVGAGNAFAVPASDLTGHWAQGTIEKWISEGLVSGYPDGSFQPDKQISRAEFVTLVNKAFKKQSTTGIVAFSDVNQTDWFYDQVIIAVTNGYISGYPDGSFGSNKPITRAEAAIIVYKVLGLSGNDQNVLTRFSDADKISPWARNGIAALVNKKIMSGYPDGSFGADKNMSRAAAIVLLDQALNYDTNAADNSEKETDPTDDSSGGAGDNSSSQAKVDTDKDGLNDALENYIWTDPGNIDTDGDSLTDGDEYNKFKTDPTKPDTDGDTVNDVQELAQGTDPSNPDSDNDGLNDDSEGRLGFDPLNPDTDGDGVIDSKEEVEQVLAPELATRYLNEENGVVPSLKLTCSGDLNHSTIIYDESSNPVIQAVGCIVGSPIDISSTVDFSSAELSFTIQNSVLAKNDINDLIIAYYNPDTNAIEPLDTLVDVSNDRIYAIVHHFSTYMVLNKKVLLYNWDVDNSSSILVNGKADIVFAIDTTGSMGSTIYNVKNNVINFVNELEAKKVDARLGLVAFKDITVDGMGSTRNLGWFTDPLDFKNAVSSLYAAGGGDEPESDVDALEEARNMGFRAGASKFIVLITDTYYKEETRFPEVTSMDQEVALLKDDGIVTSVISNTSYEAYYYDLNNETDGLFANIKASFSATLSLLTDMIGFTTTDGVWIRLSNGTSVKLKKAPDKTDMITDSDEDGLPDSQELLDEVPITLSGVTFYAWNFRSDPTNPNTDGDDFDDGEDYLPTVVYRTPVILLHGYTSDTYEAFGAKNNLCGVNDEENSTDIAKGSKYNYTSVKDQSIEGSLTANRLAYALVDSGYKINQDLYAFSYPNVDLVAYNGLKLFDYVQNLVKDPETSKYFMTDGNSYHYTFDLVGHSMGGLVSRYYIENLLGYDHVRRLITIDTPHWGSDWADSKNALIYLGSKDYAAADLDPKSTLYGGPLIGSPELKYESHGLTQYYALAGMDWPDPSIPSGAEIDNTFYVSGSVDNFDDLAEELFGDNGLLLNAVGLNAVKLMGDCVVNFRSQIGWTIDWAGLFSSKPKKQIDMDGIWVDIDMKPGHRLWDSLHNDILTRDVALEQIIEYLSDDDPSVGGGGGW